VNSIPTSFNSKGLLEPGTYEASFSDLRRSILVFGTGESKTWDQSWRNELVNRAEILVNQLWSVGIEDIFLDGFQCGGFTELSFILT
jgi:hypothetical protein